MSDSPSPRSDPYTVREGGAVEPPSTWRSRLRYLGPSIVISGSIVGSGEIILTSGLGAAAGFVMLWWVLLSCWIKSLIQAELSRYILVSGDTYVRAMNRLPGKIPLGRGRISFPVVHRPDRDHPGGDGTGRDHRRRRTGVYAAGSRRVVRLGRRPDRRRDDRTAGHRLLQGAGERDARAGHDLHRRDLGVRLPDAEDPVRGDRRRPPVGLHVQFPARVPGRGDRRVRLHRGQRVGDLRLPVLVRREGLPELHRPQRRTGMGGQSPRLDQGAPDRRLGHAGAPDLRHPALLHPGRRRPARPRQGAGRPRDDLHAVRDVHRDARSVVAVAVRHRRLQHPVLDHARRGRRRRPFHSGLHHGTRFISTGRTWSLVATGSAATARSFRSSPSPST